MTRYGTTFRSVYSRNDTLEFNKNILQPGHTWPTTHFAWVYRMYITNGWDQQPFPEWDSIDNRFLEVNETLDQVIIHPNRCDLHSHAACPISVIYRLMRLEATLYHHIRFTSNATLSDPSKITNWRLQQYVTCQLKEVSFSASTLGTVEEINVRDLSGNTLSDIHPYKSSRNRMNRRHYSVHPS